MRRDPIVDEVHRVREVYAARFNFDLAALLSDLKARQERGEFEVVYGVPRKPRRSTRRPSKGSARGSV